MLNTESLGAIQPGFPGEFRGGQLTDDAERLGSSQRVIQNGPPPNSSMSTMRQARRGLMQRLPFAQHANVEAALRRHADVEPGLSPACRPQDLRYNLRPRDA